eukprot:CAMPEP_0115071606 /NCGR_PEP_ID=MMETSP0227-20121206/13765_1 /TAXON_ID=89957 /ORGANISM="Polarella glacialis, Strain CCMP 1383" /LENGTH=401 /DNA_ID=CAMNT_0002458255 /DNA_START=9 /DNA_END=1214 /DNA_ORIENTATION=+
MADRPAVNAWTQFGRLETVVVGRADPNSCHLPDEPAGQSEINDPHIREAVPWPGGQVKHRKTIALAAAELDNLCTVLEAESAITTLRPKILDWSKPVAGPEWASSSQYCGTCPRDTMITLGNTILEATMSKRSRYFEHLACRDICLDLWRRDPERVRLWAAPKPSMADTMYNPSFWDATKKERFEKMRQYEFCVNENEPVFDAADITRVGKDIFVQKSMTTNDAGIMWLRSHFPHLRVHALHFPYDLYPSHIDCTFVPLRAPSKDADDGLVNPERPPLRSEMELWRKNGWKLLNAPMPARLDRPAFSQSSYWLSMNLLSISPDTMVIEEEELPLYNLLHDHGFEVVTVPMRNMYEFGGGIHCCTWDIKRDDACGNDGFLVNPASGKQVVGTWDARKQTSRL